MKQLFLFLLTFIAYCANAQAPTVVKGVASTELKPASDAQNKWQNQTWNGMVFYQGTGSPTKLCVTDGTTAGTKFVANLGAGGFHAVLPAKDFVYVITAEVVSFSPFTWKYEIWKSDGTAAGTSNIYTLPNAIGVSNGGQFFSDRQATYNFCLDGTTNILYFGQYDATNGNELWRTDGTAAGTFMLKDIKPGSGGSFPWGFCKIGNEVFFNATEITFERKLWKTDGTTAGTVQVPVAEPFFIVDGAIAKLGNKMVFFANNTVDGYEPYISDGTTAGTFMLGNFNTTAVNSGNSGLPYVDEANLKSNSKYCFLVLHNGTDTSLYRTDGTIAGTIRLAPAGSSIHCRVSSGGYSDVDETGIWVMKFNNAGSGNAETLYRSDGTSAGTYQVATNISYGQKLKTYKNALWFQARNIGNVANVEPWRSGGNAASTNKAFEIEPAVVPVAPFTPYSSTPYGFFVLNNDLYFWASTSIPSGHNLYKYTGNFTFNGSLAGGRWSDSTNWNGLMPPGITDTVFVNAGTPNALNINGANAFAGSLILGNNAVVNFTNPTDSLIINKSISTGINNSFTGSGVLTLKNVNTDSVVQVTNGLVANNIAIMGNANLQAGTLTVNNNLNLINNSLLTINNGNINLVGTSSNITQAGNSYINTNGMGKLLIENIGASGRSGNVLFPIGNSNSYLPVTIQNTGIDDDFSARVSNNLYATYTGETPVAQQYVTGAVNKTWFVNEASTGGSNVNLSLQWNAADELSLFNRSNTYLAHYTGGAWDLGISGAASGANPYLFNRNGITSFSPFGVMNNNAVLPLKIILFTAQQCNNNQVCLNWKTANEQSVNHFEIERSVNGITFTKVHQVNAKNQSSNNYTATDDISMLLNTGTVYYRIKQIDASGKSTFSTIQFVNLDGNKQVSIYPNPTTNIVNIANHQLVANAQLVDITGRVIKQWNNVNKQITIGEIPNGIYGLKLLLKNGKIVEQKIIKQ